MRFLACSAVAVGVAIVVACGSSTEPHATPASIALAPADTTILQDDSLQLTATVKDQAGAVLTGVGVSFTSLTPSIATVTAGGFVRSQGPSGTALIQASTTGSTTITTTTSVIVLDSTRIIRLPLSSRPTFLGLQGNVAYVSRLDTAWVKRLDLTANAFTDSAQAGNVPCGVVINGSGSRVYVANQFSDNISVINTATNSGLGTIAVNGDPLPVALSKDGTTLFVTTNVNRLFKINLGTNAVVDSLALPATSHHLLMHPNDTLMYVATRDGQSVLEVNWRSMVVARTFTLGVQTQGMQMAPDRSELYVTSGSTDSLYIVNLSTSAVTTVPVGATATTIALSADGSRIYVGLLTAGQIDVLNRITRAHIKTIRTGGTVREMATDVARSRIVVANDNGWVDIVR